MKIITKLLLMGWFVSSAVYADAATFVEDPIDRPPAFLGVAYSHSIAGAAVDADLDPLTYSKVSGPAWLNVASDGVLSGTPASVGTNAWIVQVDDGHGGTDQTMLRIRVLASGAPQLLIGGAVRNGDFNANPGVSVTFQATTNWYNTKGAQTQVATRSDGAYDGSQNATLTSGRGFGNDTGHTIADGDSFDFSYVWKDDGSWIDGSDQVTFSLFVTSDNTITGTRTDLFVDYSGLRKVDNTYELVSRTGAYTASSSDAGKRLFVAIETTSAGWARLDNVALTVNPFIQLTDLQVAYQGNGNTGGSAPVDGANPYTSGEMVTVLGNSGSLTKTDYTFAGWNTAMNGSGVAYSPGNTFTMPFLNVTLYAQWIANAYTFTNGYAPSRVNLARYQVVKANSTNGIYAPKYSTDSLVTDSSCWKSGSPGPHWLQIDFESPVQVGSSQLLMGQAGSGAMTEFQIQYFTNGIWVAVPGGYVRGNTNVEKNIVFGTPVTASSFRVYNSTDPTVTIREWALYPPNGPGGFPFGMDYMISVAERRATFATTNTYGYWPLRATDGLLDPSSVWQTTWVGSNSLTIDLQFTTQIGSAHLYSGMTGVSPISDFVLQYWTGSAWTDIPGASVSGNTNAALVIPFSSPVATTKVQLFFTNSSVSAVQELCVFPVNHDGGYPLGTGVITNTPVTAKFNTYSDSFYYLRSSSNASVLVESNGVPVLGAANPKDWTTQYQVLLNYDKGTYRLINRHSRLCLAGGRSTTEPGGELSVEEYSALPDQDWYLQAVDSTNFCLINQLTGLAAEAQGGTLVQKNLNYSSPQRWQIQLAQIFPKKGIGGTGPFKDWPTRFRASWYYGWWITTSLAKPNSDFYPMENAGWWYNKQTVQGSLWEHHPGWRRTGYSLHFMGLNEPDRVDQANIDATNGAAIWMKDVNLHMPSVAPVPANALVSWNPIFYGFITNWGGRVDYFPGHQYPGPSGGNSSSLINTMQTAYNTYGIPVWLTEFSFVDWGGTGKWSEEDNYTALAEFLWRVEGMDWFRKYALFVFTETASSPMASNVWTRFTPAPRSNTFDINANMTPFGQLYAAWDCDANVQTGKVCYVFNQGTRKQLQNTSVINATDIRCNNPTVKWTLQSAGSANLYYLVSEVDGKRLSYTNGGAVNLVASNSTGTASQWSLTEHQYGWFYLNHPASSKRLQMAFDNANAIATYSMVPDTTATTAERWRFNVPLPPPVWVGTTDNLWTAPYNWTYQVKPIIGQTVTFDEQSTTNLNTMLGADHDLAKITVTAPSGAVTIGGTNTLTVGYGGIDMSGASQNLAVSAAMVLSSTQSWSVAAGCVLSITGGASGSGAGLSVAGDGKVFLGSLATYTGDTTLSAGSTLQIGLDNALPWGAGRGAVAVHGTLDLNGYSQAINGLSGGGLIDSTAAGTMTLTLSNSTSAVFSGGIRNTAGSLSLVKEGAGTLTLSGTNTYSGTTVIAGGSVLINGLLSAGGSAVSVSSNAVLGGTGIIARPVTFSSGGTMAPGAGVGTTTFASNVVLSAGATLAVVLDDAVAPYCSKLIASNTLTMTGATLQITTNGLPSRDAYIIATYGSLSGSFAATNGLPSGYILDYNYNATKAIAIVRMIPAVYSVFYSGNGSTGGSVPVDSTAYTNSQAVTVLGNTGNLVRSGYTFNNWNTAADGSGTAYSAGNTFSMPVSNVTLYAQWTAVQTYVLTVNGGTGGGSYAASTVVPIAATPPANNQFTHWSGDTANVANTNSASTTVTMPAAAVAVTANFAINTYTVTFDLYGKGSRTGGGDLVQTVAHGSGAVEPIVSAHIGWSFDGWNTAFSSIVSNTIITALYNAIAIPLPFAEDFESRTLGDLNGQNGWEAVDTVVQTNVAVDLQAARITTGTGFAKQQFSGNETSVWTDFVVQPVFAADDLVPPDTNCTTFIYFNTNGNAVVYDGTTRLVLSGMEVSTGGWVRVTVNSDYTAKTWDLYLNGVNVANDLEFYNAAQASYEAFTVKGGAVDNGAAFDDLSIGTVSPFGEPLLLTVISDHGVPTPAGTSFAISNATVHATISGSPVINGDTQFVATGWIGTGSAPASGTETNFSFTLTSDTTIAWQWQTNYWIELNVVGE